jgi:L-fuculose-phosphate aldolase
MNSMGLNQGTSGNLSVRCNETILITPSALAYDRCQPGDIVSMEADGTVHGRRKPSSEWRLHLDIFQAHPEAGAVLHAHPPWCTTLACLDREIPPFHYMVAVAGGITVPCAEYALYGSRKLSEQVITALADRTACLMSHHGMVGFADSLDRVLALAVEVENLARVYCQALQIGEPALLDKTEMDAVLAKFADYRSGG